MSPSRKRLERALLLLSQAVQDEANARPGNMHSYEDWKELARVTTTIANITERMS